MYRSYVKICTVINNGWKKMILELLAAVLLMGGELSNTNISMQSTKKSLRSSFEEADSFF